MKLSILCKELGMGVKHNGAFLPDLDSWDGWGMSNGKLVKYDPADPNYRSLAENRERQGRVLVLSMHGEQQYAGVSAPLRRA